jgi:hypothetical protein
LKFHDSAQVAAILPSPAKIFFKKRNYLIRITGDEWRKQAMKKNIPDCTKQKEDDKN